MADIKIRKGGKTITIDSLDVFPVPSTADEILAAQKYKTSEEARAAMVSWIDTMTATVLSRYPQAVRERWPTEEAAARAAVADPRTDTVEQLALLTREGATKGRTPEQHAAVIILNADKFRAIADEVNTLFLATDALLEAVVDPAQYEVILDAAKVQAITLAQTYGLI